jgi:hypothetical protein
MFGRNKKDDPGGANRLSNEAQPNILSDGGFGPANPDSAGITFDTDLPDEDGAAAEDGKTAERAAGLKTELARQADAFGLTTDDPETLYGPNGQAVAGALEALDAIGVDQATAIARSLTAVKPADRQIAQMMARRLRHERRFDAPCRAAEGWIRDWLAARQAAGGETALYEPVADAARDAVTALILDEDLTDVDFATLYGPWSDVMDEDVDAPDGAEADEATDEEEIPADVPVSDDELEGGAEVETDANRDFGPNGELIAELLARLDGLSPDQVRSISSSWGAADKDDLARAHNALEGAIDADPDSRDEIKRAQAVVVEWAGPRPIEGDWPLLGDPTVRPREQAAPAVTDAIAALAMVDALSERDAAALYAPWAAVVGEPELPVFEEDEPS